MVTGAATMLGGIAAASARHAFGQENAGEDKPVPLATALHQEVDLPGSAARIYAALLDAKQFALFTGMPAEIDAREGGACTLFSGMIQARNVELAANQRIVQAWRPTHWDAGVWSIVEFQFKPGSARTTLVLDHKGFPAGEFDSLSSGWKSHYWEPLRKFLA
jgi:activator of HSP90 ATPase